ncbi:U-box domain-containing protein 7-like [Pistacia vera]|uniref:U-box domain-containing protein 7-like n=2 Tax=Pistacia vera TaxID=55513 RepID=UPI001262B33F|nr:U-box domain-containing protein 7-like [Pistacia vera]
MSPSLAQNMSTTSSSSSNIWLVSYLKLQFFSRIRRFLQSKAARKRRTDSNHVDSINTSSTTSKTLINHQEVIQVAVEEQIENDSSVVLQKSVKRIHFGSWEEKEMAALEIQRIAKEDVKIKKLMAELGVIHVLVSMVATEVVGRRQAAVQALIELANGTYTNKALMVEAGILTKLPKNVDVVDKSTRREFAELILLLSSLANKQFSLSSSEILPFLVGILESESSLETKELCIGTLYNLSAVLENAGPLVSNGVVSTVLKLCSVKELSEKSLATLGNLVVTLMGKKAMEDSPLVPDSLIEILTWEEKPKCQESSAYILMILAHQSSAQRDKMAKSGIVHVILEVALLGSPLAQKRALKLLQWFKDERQAKMGPHSGPQTGRIAMGSPVNPREAQEGKKFMKNLVKQSLHKNMEMITRRANAADDSSKLKSLVISTSSKSLPY